MMSETNEQGSFLQALVRESTWRLTCDDIAEFIGAVIPADKVGKADDDQT